MREQESGSVALALPAVLQRAQTYSYVGAGAPDQLPLEPVSIEPTCILPSTTGLAVFSGAAVTVPIVGEKETAVPVMLVATTRRRRYLPIWAFAGVKVLPMAPEMPLQSVGCIVLALPALVQLNQLKVWVGTG